MKDSLIRREEVLNGMIKYGFIAPDMTAHDFVKDELHSVPAVSLDKLCKWLSRNAWAFDCECCERYCRAMVECENEVGNNPEYWKNKLINWMEEQDADD